MYSRSSSSPFDGFRAFVRRGGTPVTNALLISNTILFFAAYFSSAASNWIFENLVFSRVAGGVLYHPWTLITYPLVTLSIQTLIWSGIWMFFVGGSLERSWGSSRFAAFYVVTAALFALGIAVGGAIFGDKVYQETQILCGLYPPLAAVTVAWGCLMPEEAVSIWFVPVRAKYIALAAAILAWVLTGAILGFFAEISPLAAYLYVRHGRSWGQIGHQTPRGRVVKLDFDRAGRPQRTTLDGSVARSPFDIAGRLKDSRERRRLEKLLRNSGINDPGWADDDRKYK